MDARQLLDAGPAGYTAARDTEVRRRRADGDRAGATAIKALGRPSLALWAVLAAAADGALARRVTAATTALAEAQGAAVRGVEGDDVAGVAAARRRALDAMRDAAVDRLGALGETQRRRAASQRDEIRAIVDRLSRHPELLDGWLDGTLRDVPTDTGFDAFAAITPAERAPVERAQPPPPRRLAAVRGEGPSVEVSSLSAAAERKRARDEANALAAVGAAERSLARAVERVDETRRALEEALGARTRAERALEQARRAVADAATSSPS